MFSLVILKVTVLVPCTCINVHNVIGLVQFSTRTCHFCHGIPTSLSSLYFRLEIHILLDNTEIYCILCTFIGSVQLPFLVAMASLPVLVYPVN